MSRCNDEAASHFLVYGAEKSSQAKFCHDRMAKEPKELRSNGSELTLVFNSISYDQYTPSNFKASYTFFTGNNKLLLRERERNKALTKLSAENKIEFRIEGTRAYPN